MMHSRKILLTGGAGFIGSELCMKLHNMGYELTVVDNLSPQIHGTDPNGSPSFNKIKNKVRFIYGDVQDKDIWEKCIVDNDTIIHLASETGTGQSMYNISNYVSVNSQATANLLDYIANNPNKIRRFILTSSRAVYGEGAYTCSSHGDQYPDDRDESDMKNGHFEPRCSICGKFLKAIATSETAPLKPKSIYGVTKQIQEQLVSLACRSLKIPYFIFRFQNVYGPGQSLKNPYTGILSIFSNRLRKNLPINIFEDGMESRDFIYIDDIVNALGIGVDTSESNGGVYNVGTGTGNSVIEAVNLLLHYLDSKSKAEITGNFRVGDIRHNFADISKITKIGFIPKIEFNKGLQLFIKWVETQGIENNDYDKSLEEMKEKGLFK